MNNANSELLESELPRSKQKRLFAMVGWIAFGLFSLIFFTLTKLPDDLIKANFDNAISSFLATRDITYSAEDSHLSFLFGLTYKINSITLNTSSGQKYHIDHIRISPSLLSLLIGRVAGSISIVNGPGSLESSFSAKGSSISFSFNSKKFDLGKIGILPIFAGVQGSAVIDGTGSISGDFSVPSTLEGNIALRLKNILIDPQSVMGFSIPRIGVSEGVFEVGIEKAKAKIKTLRFGKANSTAASAEDEIQGTVTGDVTLAKQWPATQLNLKVRFSLAESILKAFVLLDSILGPGKQADGTYGYMIAGPVSYPMPTPITPNGGSF